MKKIYLLFTTILFSVNAYSANQIATCSSPKGYTYYPAYGLVPPNKSGWQDDAITNGKVFLSENGGKYDISYTDSSSRGTTSSIQDGATTLILRKTNSDVQVLVSYPNDTTEIYTFWRTTDGRYQYSQLQNKSGSIPKSSVLVGSCSFINFSLLK